MATRPQRGDRRIPAELQAEHRTLREEMAALRREHDHLHTEGGTKDQHRQHIRNLRMKIKEME